MSRITDIRGREIIDSRGNPTVEADVVLASGVVGRASLPRSRSRSITAGSARIAFSSAFTLLTNGAGKPAGPATPSHDVTA